MIAGAHLKVYHNYLCDMLHFSTVFFVISPTFYYWYSAISSTTEDVLERMLITQEFLSQPLPFYVCVGCA